MKILLTGASGFIGSHILNALLSAGHDVRAAVHHRRPWRDDAGVETVSCDFSNEMRADHWLERLQGVDMVVNTVGIISEERGQRFDALHETGPIALFRACEIAGIKRVIQISALGSSGKDISSYFTSKSKADNWLRNSKLDYLILHPSMVFGPGAKSLLLLRAMAMLPLVPVIGKGEQQLQPVHVDDLSEAVVKGISLPQIWQREVPVVGAEDIGFGELLLALRRWLGAGTGRLVSVPGWSGPLIGFFGKLLGEPAMRRSTIRMLSEGNTASTESLSRLLGCEPLSIAARLRETRPARPDIQHAKLYFLAPLLRLSVAFLWIWTAIVSLFLYPQSESFALLEQVGVQAQLQPLLLYGAGLLDLAIGLALLMRYRIPAVTVIQVAVILIYSLILTLALPEFWLHPFGPVSKNIPLLVAILMIQILERR